MYMYIKKQWGSVSGCKEVDLNSYFDVLAQKSLSLIPKNMSLYNPSVIWISSNILFTYLLGK